VSLSRAVLDTLLREDFLGIRTRGYVVAGRLRFGDLSIPVRPDGFLCDIAVAEPVVERCGVRFTELPDILSLFRELVEPEDIGGFDAFVDECRAARETEDTQRTHRTSVPPARTGMAGSLAYDAIAAYTGHPVYPTGLARHGISQQDQRRYAPEHHPTFRLRWTPVPAERVTAAGPLPAWWPAPGDLGLPADVVPFPVHPLTGTGVEGPIAVTPTLSMRTVAVLADPTTHLKVPLPTSTLGRLNRRTMKPGTLIDGAVTGRLLEAVLAREPRFAGRVLLADEQTYRHAGDERLAVLVRRYPAGLESADIVPLAALNDRFVLESLADKYFRGDRTALFTDYLTLLLDFQTTLLVRYGIALESHQQNVSLVLDGSGIRLLFKDNDGPRIRLDRFPFPDLALLDDQRILVDDTGPLVDVFTTITLHLCAAAIVGVRNAALIRDLLAAAIDRHPDCPDATLLRASTLDADRLPVKAMVTAGTLLSKQRSGAVDVNKFYLRSGPNYLA
jgi:siderophore synthetase component